MTVFHIPQLNAEAEFYIPESDDDIVAVLPADVVTLASRMRRTASNDAKLDSAEPQQQARQILESYHLATSSNSARAYGHTLALLLTWPAQSELPPILRLIKADILQHNHAFSEALVELDQLLKFDASSLSALRMKSQILLVTGDYEAAQTLCSKLTSSRHTLAANNCQAQLDGLTGAAELALSRVQSMLQSPTNKNIDSMELYITAAGLAYRLGRVNQAEAYYIAALGLQADHDYVLVNYADMLIDTGRATDAVSLLAHESDNPNKLELQLIYIQALLLSDRQEPVAAQLENIHETIAVLLKRREERPSKLLARYYLTISHDYDAAHLEAMANWQVQKEPSDSWLLAQAAVAAQRWDSLDQLLQWFRSNEQEDFRVEDLVTRQGLSI